MLPTVVHKHCLIVSLVTKAELSTSMRRVNTKLEKGAEYVLTESAHNVKVYSSSFTSLELLTYTQIHTLDIHVHNQQVESMEHLKYQHHISKMYCTDTWNVK